VLHRIAFPVVSEWCQQRHTWFTIVLASSKRPNGVQHLAGHASIQLTLDHDMHWIPSMDRDTADGIKRWAR